MSDEAALPSQHAASLDVPQGWRVALNWTAAILISIVFLVAGLWKASDPIGAAVRLAQAKVPEMLSIPAAIGFGIAETTCGVLLLIPRFRQWGSWIASLLLISFMIFIGIHYNELVGAECSCFPWVKRAVGPQFFVGDGIMLALAIGAGIGVRKSAGFRPALLIMGAVAVFAFTSYGMGLAKTSGTKAPDFLTSEDGKQISLREGKTFIYFFNPHCMHCLEAGRKLATLNWGDTHFVGVATEAPQDSQWFLGHANLQGKGPVATDLNMLKKVFPFDLPPAGVAIENGYQKVMLLQFEGDEPAATLKKLGFAH
jgi:hypothetical protein